MKAPTRLYTLAMAAVVAFAACSAPGITDPGTDGEGSSLLGPPAGLTASLIECPTTETLTATSLVTTLGGAVSVGGMTITVPAGALLSDANVTVTVPASRFLEVDIKVSGAEHFIFEAPVVVTMSYARCGRSDLNLTSLSAWYIDSDTKQPLEKMPSVDDKLLRTVTFTTGHLSGYAIAN